MPVHFVATVHALPRVARPIKCCSERHSTSAILSTCLAIFCTSATFTATAFPSPSPPSHFLCTSHIPSLAFFPISHFPPRFFPPRCAFLTALCTFWHICCLDTGFQRLPLVHLPCWRYRWKRLILYFPKSPKALQSDIFNFLLHVLHIKTHREHVRTTESTQYPSCSRVTLPNLG
jgi:hypothetical protein